MKADSVSLDYAYSDDAAEIDTGIRETIKGVRLSILAIGMGLAKIKKKRLYIDLDCKSIAAYIQKLCDETKMDRSSLFNWLYIGEAEKLFISMMNLTQKPQITSKKYCLQPEKQ